MEAFMDVVKQGDLQTFEDPYFQGSYVELWGPEVYKIAIKTAKTAIDAEDATEHLLAQCPQVLEPFLCLHN
jgi:hypothetical protein